MYSGTSSRLKHLEAEVSHAQNLLVLKTGTVSELAAKQKTLKAQLRRSRRESRDHATRADALESRSVARPLAPLMVSRSLAAHTSVRGESGAMGASEWSVSGTPLRSSDPRRVICAARSGPSQSPE